FALPGALGARRIGGRAVRAWDGSLAVADDALVVFPVVVRLAPLSEVSLVASDVRTRERRRIRMAPGLRQQDAERRIHAVGPSETRRLSCAATGAARGKSAPFAGARRTCDRLRPAACDARGGIALRPHRAAEAAEG